MIQKRYIMKSEIMFNEYKMRIDVIYHVIMKFQLALTQL